MRTLFYGVVLFLVLQNVFCKPLFDNLLDRLSQWISTQNSPPDSLDDSKTTSIQQAASISDTNEPFSELPNNIQDRDDNSDDSASISTDVQVTSGDQDQVSVETSILSTASDTLDAALPSINISIDSDSDNDQDGNDGSSTASTDVQVNTSDNDQVTVNTSILSTVSDAAESTINSALTRININRYSDSDDQGTVADNSDSQVSVETIIGSTSDVATSTIDSTLVSIGVQVNSDSDTGATDIKVTSTSGNDDTSQDDTSSISVSNTVEVTNTVGDYGQSLVDNLSSPFSGIAGNALDSTTVDAGITQLGSITDGVQQSVGIDIESTIAETAKNTLNYSSSIGTQNIITNTVQTIDSGMQQFPSFPDSFDQSLVEAEFQNATGSVQNAMDSSIIANVQQLLGTSSQAGITTASEDSDVNSVNVAVSIHDIP